MSTVYRLPFFLSIQADLILPHPEVDQLRIEVVIHAGADVVVVCTPARSLFVHSHGEVSEQRTYPGATRPPLQHRLEIIEILGMVPKVEAEHEVVVVFTAVTSADAVYICSHM